MYNPYGNLPPKEVSSHLDPLNPAEFLKDCDNFLEWLNDPNTSISDLEKYSNTGIIPNTSKRSHFVESKVDSKGGEEKRNFNPPPSGEFTEGSIWVHPSTDLFFKVKDGKWKFPEEDYQDPTVFPYKISLYLKLYPDTRLGTYLSSQVLIKAVIALIADRGENSVRTYWSSLTRQFIVGLGEKSISFTEETISDMTPNIVMSAVENVLMKQKPRKLKRKKDALPSAP